MFRMLLFLLVVIVVGTPILTWLVGESITHFIFMVFGVYVYCNWNEIKNNLNGNAGEHKSNGTVNKH